MINTQQHSIKKTCSIKKVCSIRKYLILGVINLVILSLQTFCAQPAAGLAQAESEQMAKQEQEIMAQDAGTASAQDRAKMALLLNIQKSVTANTALKQSILGHDKKIAELELALNKKEQTWFDWAASFFKAQEPKKPRALGQFKTELTAATAAYAVSKGGHIRFDQQFLFQAWKKQKMYEAELKKIIVGQKQEIDRLQAQI
jgi:hypothetical protein